MGRVERKLIALRAVPSESLEVDPAAGTEDDSFALEHLALLQGAAPWPRADVASSAHDAMPRDRARGFQLPEYGTDEARPSWKPGKASHLAVSGDASAWDRSHNGPNRNV